MFEIGWLATSKVGFVSWWSVLIWVKLFKEQNGVGVMKDIEGRLLLVIIWKYRQPMDLANESLNHLSCDD